MCYTLYCEYIFLGLITMDLRKLCRNQAKYLVGFADTNKHPRTDMYVYST